MIGLLGHFTLSNQVAIPSESYKTAAIYRRNLMLFKQKAHSLYQKSTQAHAHTGAVTCLLSHIRSLQPYCSYCQTGKTRNVVCRRTQHCSGNPPNSYINDSFANTSTTIRIWCEASVLFKLSFSRKTKRMRKLVAERTLRHTPTNKKQSTALVVTASYFTIMDGNGWHKGSFFLHIGMATAQEPIHPTCLAHGTNSSYPPC